MITIFSQPLLGFPCFLQLPSREDSWNGQASYTMISRDPVLSWPAGNP